MYVYTERMKWESKKKYSTKPMVKCEYILKWDDERRWRKEWIVFQKLIIGFANHFTRGILIFRDEEGFCFCCEGKIKKIKIKPKWHTQKEI